MPRVKSEPSAREAILPSGTLSVDEGDFIAEDGPAVHAEIPFVATTPVTAQPALTPETLSIMQAAMTAALAAMPQAQGQGITGEMLAQILAANTAGIHKALKPENPVSPQVSVFNPLGERDHPRPKLAMPDAHGVLRDYECLLGPYPMDRGSLTREEIELLNALTAGEYFITKADNAKVKLTVRCDVSDAGVVRIKQLLIPASGDDAKHNWPPLVSMLREALGAKAPNETSVDALRAEITALKARLGSAAA